MSAPAAGWVAVGIGYLLGAVPFGLILGQVTGGTDVRRVGSGNIGATNVARALGAGAGVAVLLLDAGKGAAAAALGRTLGKGESFALLAGLAAVIGHVFPIYLRFRGGKGVATGVGAFLVLQPVATLMAVAIFGGVVLAGRRVSLGSVVAAAALPAILLLRQAPAGAVAAGLVAASLIIYRHRENLRRILDGTEPRMGASRR